MNDRSAAPAKRFSGRVADYVRHRPRYPEGVIDLLRAETSLSTQAVIADVGSGTGLSAELFLRHGNKVFGVEPNPEMRAAAVAQLAKYDKFHSVDGTAEATTLPSASVDYVVAGQAFHWFDVEATRVEFARILRPRGWCVLLWNARRLDATPFLAAYEELLQRFGTDYREVRHENITDSVLRSFFAGGAYQQMRLDNEQRLDYHGLRGRLLSSSYTPSPGHPNYEPMLAELQRIFDQHSRGGEVVMEYDVQIYLGRVA